MPYNANICLIKLMFLAPFLVKMYTIFVRLFFKDAGCVDATVLWTPVLSANEFKLIFITIS